MIVFIVDVTLLRQDLDCLENVRKISPTPEHGVYPPLSMEAAAIMPLYRARGAHTSKPAVYG